MFTKELLEKLKWENKTISFNEKQAINDFVFMCFAVGNDFLPHIPSIEIIENGVEMMIDIYKKIGKQAGHLTSINSSGKVLLNKDVLCLFFKIIGQHELDNFERKLSSKVTFFPDELMLKHSYQDENKRLHLDLTNYTSEYNQVHFENQNLQNLIDPSLL